MVEPEEAAALADAMGTNGEDAASRVTVVVPRDFTEPRTLSADRINRIHKTLSSRLQAMANLLAASVLPWFHCEPRRSIAPDQSR